MMGPPPPPQMMWPYSPAHFMSPHPVDINPNQQSSITSHVGLINLPVSFISYVLLIINDRFV